jgi:hypothetical protein
VAVLQQHLADVNALSTSILDASPREIPTQERRHSKRDNPFLQLRIQKSRKRLVEWRRSKLRSKILELLVRALFEAAGIEFIFSSKAF